jgi:CubicO group peptidase (beta-lactamase class C family)
MLTQRRLTNARIESALQRAIQLGEIGVQVAAYLKGRIIVNTWSGLANQEAATYVDDLSLFPVFSVTKGIVSTAIHIQAERGYVEYDAPISTYWPEFATHGKVGITVRHMLSHRSGMPQMPPGIAPNNVADWDHVTRGIADLIPLCPPGTKSTYSAIAYVWTLGEVVRRTDPSHRPFGRFIREEICEPLGANDFWLGLPETEDHRVARTEGSYPPPPPSIAPLRAAASPADLAPRPATANRREVWRSPRTAVTNAQSCARIFAMLANGGELDGVRLLSGERVRSFLTPRPRPEEFDEVVGQVHGAGLNGYWLGGPYPPADPIAGVGSSVISYPGAGGSIAWADLDSGLAAAICHNRMFSNNPPLPIDRHPFFALGEAIRESAAELDPASVLGSGV